MVGDDPWFVYICQPVYSPNTGNVGINHHQSICNRQVYKLLIYLGLPKAVETLDTYSYHCIPILCEWIFHSMHGHRSTEWNHNYKLIWTYIRYIWALDVWECNEYVLSSIYFSQTNHSLNVYFVSRKVASTYFYFFN